MLSQPNRTPPGRIRAGGKLRRGMTLALESLEDRRMLAGPDVTISPDFFTAYQDSPTITLDVLANDIFEPTYVGERQITSASSGSLGGTARVTDDGQFIEYRPLTGVHGEESLLYIVDDAHSAKVTLTIQPALVKDEYEVVEQSGETRLFVLANDPFSPDYNGARVITSVSETSRGGTVRIADDGRSVYYAPPTDTTGADFFRYLVDDQFDANVTVHIRRPVRDDRFEVDQDSRDNTFYPLTNDTYRDLFNQNRRIVNAITAVNAPEQGGVVTIAADGQSVRYSPPDGFIGYDRFSYLADGLYQAQVVVDVSRPVRGDYISVIQQTPSQTLDVLANDFYSATYDGPRKVTAVTQPENGSVLIPPDGRSLVYTPVDLFTGSDQLEYTVDDTFTTTVQLSVQPLARSDYFSFGISPFVNRFTLRVLDNDYFNRGYQGPGRITAVSEPSDGGTVEILSDRASLRFQPQEHFTGYTTFSYTVDELFEANVSVSLDGFLSPDAFNVHQNSEVNVLQVTSNDFRYEHHRTGFYNGPRVITAVSDAVNGGTVAIGAVAGTVVYTPPEDFHGQDSFTYEVDGVQSTSVTVNVIRFARDDRFRVDPNTQGNILRVTVNDRVDPRFGDVRPVASVSEPASGGEATVGADGQSVVYTPPVHFSGTDTFSYHLDNGSRADVEVQVIAEVADILTKFDDLAAMEVYLLENSLKQYEYWFGQQGGGFVDFEDGVAPTADRNHSETNVQVAGIDEGDVVEFDSDYVYVLTQDSVLIADAWPADELHTASRTKVEGVPLVEYLDGDRLTVISDTSVWIPGDDIYEPVAFDVIGAPWSIFQEIERSVTVTVFDVSDRTSPAIVQETKFDGQYTDSRAVNGFVFLVMQHPFLLPPPELQCEEENNEGEDDPFRSLCTYETRDEYIERVQQNFGELLDEVLPHFTSYAAGHEFVRGGLLTEAADIYRPDDDDASELLVVTSIDMAGDDAGPIASAAIPIASGSANIYASLDNLYVFHQRYGQFWNFNVPGSPEPQTAILKFAWNTANGQLDFAAQGEVPGVMNNQFSSDEHNGFLRIATTTTNPLLGQARTQTANELYVFADNGGIIEGVSSLPGLAPTETIRSVRFLGDRAFVVTFRDIDPLFAIDLSDPYRPHNAGQLLIPGFSSYMQPITDQYIIGLGRNSPDGFGGPPQLSVFDVSDMTAPKRVDQFTWAHWSWTEAAFDHHAFGYFAEHGLLAIPVGNWQRRWVDDDGDGFRDRLEQTRHDDLYVFEIDASGNAEDETVELLGTVSHDFQVRRSGFIGDRLYSISTDDIIATDVTDPSSPLATLTFGAWLEEPDPPFLPTTRPELADAMAPITATPLDDRYIRDVVQGVSQDMADQLFIDAGRVSVISVEAGIYEETCRSAADGFSSCVTPLTPSYEVVVEAEGSRFWYRATSQDDVQIVDARFHFQAAARAHNDQLPTDANDDGVVSPVDAALVINALGDPASAMPRPLPLRSIQAPLREPFYVDIDDDGVVSPVDAITVLNKLAEHTNAVTARRAPRAPLSAQSAVTPSAEMVPGDALRSVVPVHNVDRSLPPRDTVFAALTDNTSSRDDLVARSVWHNQTVIQLDRARRAHDEAADRQAANPAEEELIDKTIAEWQDTLGTPLAERAIQFR